MAVFDILLESNNYRKRARLSARIYETKTKQKREIREQGAAVHKWNDKYSKRVMLVWEDVRINLWIETSAQRHCLLPLLLVGGRGYWYKRALWKRNFQKKKRKEEKQTGIRGCIKWEKTRSIVESKQMFGFLANTPWQCFAEAVRPRPLSSAPRVQGHATTYGITATATGLWWQAGLYCWQSLLASW